MVNSDPGFTMQPKVVDAASELLADAGGDGRRHTRSAVGPGALPMGLSVEMILAPK